MEKINAATALLDTTWDNIDDLPSYVQLLDSSSILTLQKGEFIKDESKDSARVVITAEVKEILEVPEGLSYQSKVAETVPGSLVSFSYSGDVGIRAMKRDWMQVIEGLQAPSPAAFLEGLAGAEIAVTTKSRKDRNDPDKRYTDLVTATLA